MREKTWKVLKWENRPATTAVISLACPTCSTDAELPMGPPGALIIASIGLRLVFDPPGHQPPPHFMPDEIKCRTCGTVYSQGAPVEVPADVR